MIFRPVLILVALALLIFCTTVAETAPVLGYGTTATGRTVGSLGFSPMTPRFGAIGGNFRLMTPGFGRITNGFSSYYNNQFAPLNWGFGRVRSHFQPMMPRFQPFGSNTQQLPAGQVPWNVPFAQSYQQGFNSMAPNFGLVAPGY